VGVKRLLLAVCLTAFASILLVPGASAGNFDEEKMGCTGEAPATCATGTVGQPYSITIYLVPPDGGRGEDFDCATFHHTSGSFPPGLSISDEGYITGTPTEAGNFQFYLTVRYDKEGCAKPASDDSFIIPINPGVPRLVIGPEQSGVPTSTVGAPFSLQMTASLPDAKTWSIVEGSGTLPPGVQLGATDGLISGTPTTAGTYAFTVRAEIDAQRSDTKALAIVVRDPISIAAPELAGTTTSGFPPSEVGVRFSTLFAATGGAGTYTWSRTGSLPPGVVFGATGDLTGQPTAAGTYRFTVTATDAEGRTGTYNAMMTVAPRLAVGTTQLKIGRVGRYYQFKLRARGGVAPWKARIKRGPLPRGILFDPTVGVFYGAPTRVGTWRITVEMIDALGIKATATVKLVVRR
jgi:hypothetical protein